MPDSKSNAPGDPTVTASVVPQFTKGGDETTGLAPAAPAAPPPTHQLGEYAILGELGRGGMGVVYRAEDQRLKREVALKVMLPQFASNQQAKSRFVREARAQAKVEHDHVAAIFQVADHDGLPYIVMPLLKGMTLHAALRANPRPPLAEVIRIGRETAEGLAAAHEKGLVHRDIKPANIWLEGKKLRVKVLDFGLARLASETGDNTEHEDGPVTYEGAIIGTPSYMSPEQGRGATVDARTDLWSLGIMLYQMTTGELPFQGANTLAILNSLAMQNPPAPIERNPAVSSVLSHLVMRLLAKDPALRPPSADAIAEELRQIEFAFLNSVHIVVMDSRIAAAPEFPLAMVDPFSDLDASEPIHDPSTEPVARPEVEKREPKPRPSRKGFPVWAFVAIVVLLGGGVVAFVVMQSGKKPVDVAERDDVTPKLPPTTPTQKLPVGTPKPPDPDPIVVTNPADDKTLRDLVQAPPEFDTTIFAAVPKVTSPVAIAATPTGELFVAVDERGEQVGPPGGGRILRCVDRNGDGKVDDVTLFANVEHPRGVLYRSGSVWVMHPPKLSVFRDTGTGAGEQEEVLVTGLTTDAVNDRVDHTTNCLRMGIDGWIYIGVGDFGIREAKGKDGSTISLRGGGIVRVRPDGTELEVYCAGLRNPFDVAIDPFMNIFFRDNGNGALGWETRLVQVFQSGRYGYPSLFKNFTEETLPPLATFGGGGGTGAVFVQDSRWPEAYRNTVISCSYGRNEVYRHSLQPQGATFTQKHDLFLKVPRVTGLEIDGSGRLYVASWRNGGGIGVIARVTPKGWKFTPFPNLTTLTDQQLVSQFLAPEAVTRLQTQGEILKRGRKPETTAGLLTLASDNNATLEGRAAAIFTLKQLDGKDSHPALVKLYEDETVRQFVLRALTDRKAEAKGLDPTAFVAALGQKSPLARAQALIALGRLNNAAIAKSLLPLTIREEDSRMPTQKPLQNQPDAGRVVPHLAVQTLVALNAADACVDALDGPHWQGALAAMRQMHTTAVVEGLIKKFSTVRANSIQREIISTFIRLYHRESTTNWRWWGVTPDTTGPYFDGVEWEMSKRIASVITTAATSGDAELRSFIKAELTRQKVHIAGVSDAVEPKSIEKEVPISVAKSDPKNPAEIGNLAYEVVVERTLAAKGDATKGEALFKSQSCIACHTTADGQSPKGPHLVDIGRRLKPEELLEAILKPSAKLSPGFETYRFVLSNEQVFLGFVVGEAATTIQIRETNGTSRTLKHSDLATKVLQKQSSMPEGIVGNLTPNHLADLLAYLQSLK
ncbi:MAG: protein kinase [Planctomycetes bacterium]|nr:protein kinase [Planctomycetota bacterium]